MSNVIDFVTAKEKLQEQPKLEDGTIINNEIAWAIEEAGKIDDFIFGLEEDISHARNAKLELLTYHAGMVMAKNIAEGNEVDMFWSHEEDTEMIDKLEEALEELETTRGTVNGIASFMEDKDTVNPDD